MSVIFLVHDRHGAKIAVSEAEAKQDELNGWKRHEPEAEAPAEEPKSRRRAVSAEAPAEAQDE